MKHSKNIVFLGSRFHVLEQLLDRVSLDCITIYALEQTVLTKILDQKGIAHHTFTMKDKDIVLKKLIKSNFDILISNGCPIIFPVHKFKKEQILINVHPTYLPYLQGKTPLNGVFYDDYNFYGATAHYIDDGIDTGAIIFQKKETLTPDIDLGLLYHLAMKLEGIVFKEAWKILLAKNFTYVGRKQSGNSTYFNRTEGMQKLDFTNCNTNQILKCIKSFGIGSQGSFAMFDNVNYKIFTAEKIVHQPLLDTYSKEPSGKIVLNYDDKFLVKTNDGLIKITRYTKS